MLPEHIPSAEEIYIAVKSFMYAFLLQLAVERGIKRNKVKKASLTPTATPTLNDENH